MCRHLSLAYWIWAIALTLLFSCQSNESEKDRFAKIHLKQAQSLHSIGQLKAAEEQSLLALDLKPNLPGAIDLLSDIYINTDRSDQALTLTRLSESKRDNAENAYLYLRALVKTGDFRKTLEELDSRPAWWAKQAENASWLRGRAHENKGEFEEAHAIFTTNFESHDHQPSHIGMLRTGILLQKYEWVRSEVLTALSKNSEDDQILNLQAQLFIASGEWANAEKSLSAALSKKSMTDILTDDRVAILRNLSSVLLQLNRTQEPLVYDQLIAQQRKDFLTEQARINQSLELLNQNRESEAIIFLRDLLVDFRQDMTAQELLAQFRFKKGEYAEAARILHSKRYNSTTDESH